MWAHVLQAVPDARLVLKWRTFNDDAFRQQVVDAFVIRGIAVDRIELRGPSFHADLLKEYADIDIALDPFPFSGGLTSCEALWMGVPVITWPSFKSSPANTAESIAVIQRRLQTSFGFTWYNLFVTFRHTNLMLLGEPHE